MADVYVFDTNVYVAALRDPRQLTLLKRFAVRIGLRLRLSAVVAMELQAGAVTRAHASAVDTLGALYVERDLVIVPSAETYVQAGGVLARLRIAERMSLADFPRSFVNDVLLASSCRECGAVLVTANAHDFAVIRRHLRGFRFKAAASVCE